MKICKLIVLSAIMLLGAVSISAKEQDGLEEITSNWLTTPKKSPQRALKSSTPPGEPDWAPVSDGVWLIVAAAGIYGLISTSRKKANGK
jgi:hypothetical protein